MTLSTDLTHVLSQIRWADGLAKRCQPYTPTEAEATQAWSKLRGLDRLRWGCKLRIVFKEDADWMVGWDGPDWEKQGLEAPADHGFLIAIPGQQCASGDEGSGVVWIPHTRAEKDEGEPAWVTLLVLLANPMVAWVEVA